MPAPVEVLTPASSRSEMAPVSSGSALASSTGVSVPLVDEDPLVLAVVPWSPNEVEYSCLVRTGEVESGL